MLVSTKGVVARIRPRTDDLQSLASAYEPKTAEWFQVEHGETVIDVGSHIGLYTLLAARKASRVISIEADSSNYSLLVRNIHLNGFSNVNAILIAASNAKGKVPLYKPLSTFASMSSLEARWSAERGVPAQEAAYVDCDTIDNIVNSYGLDVIDWLKIDVEGHEAKVLEGAQSTLRKTRRLILEVSNQNVELCKKLTSVAGLRLHAVEHGDPASNWLLIREAVIS